MICPIFLDTNIAIYASGQPHIYKSPCAQVLNLVAERPTSFFTDAEVFQELLHRYLSLQIWPQGKEVFQRFGRLMQDRVESIIHGDLEQAALLADTFQGVSARDLLHRAVMARLGSGRIVSADRDFERFPEVERLDPLGIDLWRTSI